MCCAPRTGTDDARHQKRDFGPIPAYLDAMVEQHEYAGSDTPTPPHGMPVVDPSADLDTPPEGIGLGELINAEDVPKAAPSVIGDAPTRDASADAGEWPTLQRRERQDRSRRGFFRRS